VGLFVEFHSDQLGNLPPHLLRFRSRDVASLAALMEQKGPEGCSLEVVPEYMAVEDHRLHHD